MDSTLWIIGNVQVWSHKNVAPLVCSDFLYPEHNVSNTKVDFIVLHLVPSNIYYWKATDSFQTSTCRLLWVINLFSLFRSFLCLRKKDQKALLQFIPIQRTRCVTIFAVKKKKFNMHHHSSWINIIFQSTVGSFNRFIKEQCVSVLSTPVGAQIKPRKCRTKPRMCLLTPALLDNTFLLGQRGNIQMGSP